MKERIHQEIDFAQKFLFCNRLVLIFVVAIVKIWHVVELESSNRVFNSDRKRKMPKIIV